MKQYQMRSKFLSLLLVVLVFMSNVPLVWAQLPEAPVTVAEETLPGESSAETQPEEMQPPQAGETEPSAAESTEPTVPAETTTPAKTSVPTEAAVPGGENPEALPEQPEQLPNPPDMGENPDHLTAPDDAEIAVPVDENIYPETLFDPAPKMMRARRVSSANNPPIIGADHPENPGEVMLFKEAKEVPGMVNTFDVTLRMEAKDSTKKSDIVLVMDTSGSMRDNGRMPKAIEAANQFVDSLLPSSTTRIAVVSFAEGVDTKQPLTNDATRLHSAINSLQPNGGTFTQAGIRQADAILNHSDADFKHIVLLSDGEPTYSYKIKSNGGYNPNNYYNPNVNPNINIPQAAFQYPTRVGSGSSLTGYYRNTLLGTKYYFNNGNNAIAESKYAKADGKSVWTIALQAGVTGNQVLNAVASQDQSYTADPDDLARIFAEIGGKIASAMQNCHVTDPMGAGFEIPVGEVSNVIAVPATPAPSYDTSVTPHKLIWEPGTLTLPISPGSDVKYAELKYRVVINDDILGAQGQNGQYDTNGNAQITYVDIDGREQTIPFPNPMAKPVIVEMKKVLLDSAGYAIPDSDDRTFNFNLKLQDDNQFNQDYVVKGNKSRVMTDLRIDKVYNFQENAVAGTHPSTLDDYDITISWKTWDGSQQGTETISGTNLESFKVPRDSSNEPLNTTITVTNKEKADGKLILKKEFDPSEGLARRARRAEAPTYQITVVGKSLYSNEEIYRQTYAVKVGESKEITGLRYGRYFISEGNLNPSFEDDYGDPGDGEVEIRIDNKTANVKVINKPDSHDSQVNLMVKKTWLGGIPTGANIGFTVQADGVELENQPGWEKLSNGDLQTFGITAADNEEYYQAVELLKYNTQGLPIAYTITETGVPNGYVSTVPAEPTEVTYGNPPQEERFLQWAVSNAPQKDITVTKHWNDADRLDRAGVTLTLYRQIENGTPEAVTGADVFTPSLEKTTNNETYTWENLPLYNSEGKAYTYFVKEVFTEPGNINNQNWTIAENNNVTFDNNGGTVTVTNTPLPSDRLGTLIINKKLVNGEILPTKLENETVSRATTPLALPKEARPLQLGLAKLGKLANNLLAVGKDFAALLIRDGATPLTFSFKVTGPGGYSETFTLKAGEEKVLEHLLYGQYKVVETEVDGFTASYDPANGEVTLTKDSTTATVTVTNTNNGGANVARTVEKVWVNGPKPATTIELWRKGQKVDGAEIDEKVAEFEVPANASAEQLKETFENLPKYDPSGREFEYYAKEPTEPENYTATYSDDKLTVTNTYTQPQTAEDVKATKTWANTDNYTPKPEIRFTLYRYIGEGSTIEQVPGTAEHPNPQIVPAGGEVNFGKQLKTDINGVDYIYFVGESFTNTEEADNWTVTGLKTLNLTNTLKGEDDRNGKLTVKKVLKNETPPPVDKSAVRAPRALRNAPLTFSFTVTGPGGYSATFTLKAGEEKVLDKLLYGEYTVTETEVDGFTASYNPDGGKVTLTKTASEATVTVTNTNNGGANVDKTVEKVWVNGPKPATTIELWRKGYSSNDANLTEPDINEEVGTFNVPANASAEQLKETFENLPKYDPSGREFEYYVKEENVPENYEKKIEGLTVTNTYQQPETDAEVKATKTWTNADNYTPKPEIKFELWRKGGTAGAGEKVVDATALTNNEVNFGKQLKTDINGVEYTYFVKEIFTNVEEKDNWNITGDGSALAITNALKPGSETAASLTIQKVLENEEPEPVPRARSPRTLRAGNPLIFTFKVTGPGGYTEIVMLKAGEQKTLNNLHFGAYKVEETESHGFEPQFEPGPEVKLTKDNREATITVTNINDGGANIEITVEKKWVGGSKPKTMIELWRKGQKVDGAEIDEKVAEFEVPANASAEQLKETFENLPKYDPSGREFEYYAKEPNVPQGYKASFSEDRLTVTNTYQTPVTPPIIPGYHPQPHPSQYQVDPGRQPKLQLPEKRLPVTGETASAMPLYLGLTALLLVTLSIVLKRRR